MRKVLEPIVHGIIWIFGYILFAVGSKNIGVFNSGDYAFFYSLTMGTLINILLFYTVSLKIIPGFTIHRKALTIVLMVLAIFALATIIESLLDYFFFRTVYSSESEPFGSQLILNLVSNLFIIFIALAYGFTRSWMNNEKLKQKLKEEKLKAELSFLKTQINPHFLFNVLNTAFSSAMSSGDEDTANIIEKLAGLMRYNLYESNADKVDLEKEIDYINRYISLQKIRISSNVLSDINFKISGNCTQKSIAPLILIPFVENAFKHGLKLGNKSEIKIELFVEGNHMKFMVSNQRTEVKTKSKFSGVGLENVKRRLSLLYTNKHNLTINDNNEVYTVCLEIDLI